MAENRTNYYIVSSIFLAYSVAFVFAQWIGTESERFKMASFSVYLYLSLLFLVSNAAMLHSMVQGRRQQTVTQTSGAHAQCDNKYIVSGVAKGGLVVFMIGTVIYDSIEMVGTFDCFGVFLSMECKVKKQIIILIHLTLKLLFLGVQVMFLLSESDLYSKHGRSNTSRNVYVINAVVNFTTIVDTILYESRLAIQPNSLIKAVSCTVFPNATFPEVRHAMSCMNGTTDIFSIAASLETYVYTYHSEFCILATSLNQMLWRASCSNADGSDDTQVESPSTGTQTALGFRRRLQRELRRDEEASALPSSGSPSNGINSELEDSFLINAYGYGEAGHLMETRGSSVGYGSMSDVAANNAESERRVRFSTFEDSFSCCSKCQESLDLHSEHVTGSENSCGCLSFLGVAISIILSVLLVLQHNNKDSNHLDNPIFVLSLVEFAAMTVASILLAIVTTRQLNRGPSIPKTFSVGSIVIMLSALFMHVFNFLILISALNLLVDWNSINPLRRMSTTDLFRSVTDIIEVPLDCLHVAMQTKLVLNICWIMKRNHIHDVTSSSTAMQCVVFLMVGNFSKWILGTIIEIQDPGVNSSQSIYFGKEAWTAVVYTFYPFVVYFRFHCSMALAEYMLWRREIKNSGRQHPFLPSIGTFTYY